MKMFSPDLPERRRILKEICHSNSQWKPRLSVVGVMFLLAIGIIAYTVVLLINHHTSSFGIFIFLCVGVCLACVPFFIGVSAKNSAKYKCGLPFSSYANGTLLLHDNKLEYVFWRVGPREPAAYSSKRAVYKEQDKFVYSVEKKDIVQITIKDDVCRITGTGFTAMPEWAEDDATVKRTCSEFAFILAFEQRNADKSIMEWRN